MKVKREWSDEQEVFGVVFEALAASEDFSVTAFDEVGAYGDKGTVVISMDGRRFALDLHEII